MLPVELQNTISLLSNEQKANLRRKLIAALDQAEKTYHERQHAAKKYDALTLGFLLSFGLAYLNIKRVENAALNDGVFLAPLSTLITLVCLSAVLKLQEYSTQNKNLIHNLYDLLGGHTYYQLQSDLYHYNVVHEIFRHDPPSLQDFKNYVAEVLKLVAGPRHLMDFHHIKQASAEKICKNQIIKKMTFLNLNAAIKNQVSVKKHEIFRSIFRVVTENNMTPSESQQLLTDMETVQANIHQQSLG